MYYQRVHNCRYSEYLRTFPNILGDMRIHCTASDLHPPATFFLNIRCYPCIMDNFVFLRIILSDAYNTFNTLCASSSLRDR